MIDDRVTDADDIPGAALCYVLATDTFMSGWGEARGKTNVLIVPCDTEDDADEVLRRLRRRSEMSDVRTVPHIDEIPATWFAQVKDAAVVRTWITDTQIRPHDIDEEE